MAIQKSFMKNKKAVSPVISTIIIVSVAIVMSIAVAYWMLGLGASFTRFEKLEFTSAYVTDSGANFVVSIKVKNTGTASLTIDQVLLNGKPADAYNGTVTISWDKTSLEPGASANGQITLVKGSVWNSGMSVEANIRSVAGRDYPKTVTLP